MNCNHEKIKSVNCEIFCLFCGEKLPIDYLAAKARIAAQKSAEKPLADVPADDNPVVAETPAETPGNGGNDPGGTAAPENNKAVAENPGKKEQKPAAKGRVKGGRK